MKVPLLWSLFFAASLLASCSDSEPAKKSGAFKIAVIPKGTAHEFWKAVEQGARKADDEFEDLTIVWKGPSGEGDAPAQIALVESFIADGVDGICLAPLDARALEKPVRAAAAAKIPVVIFDSGLASADAPIASFVATDNYKGGEMAGAELAEALKGEGKVILLRYVLGSESTEQREKGFLDAIAKHPKIEVLSSDKHGGPTEADAVAVSETLLSNFGEKVNGVFCSNESATSGFLTALARDSRGLGGKVIVVGFDSSKKIEDALATGALRATVIQDPTRMGYLAVVAMHTRLTGGTPKARIDTGERLIHFPDLPLVDKVDELRTLGYTDRKTDREKER
ncbi:MAG TPA: substrate-binding domain-containing protein [Planctomycetota bacterium]|nr:substrate-binding domain-containing protein [Planctomycetota bacterium]